MDIQEQIIERVKPKMDIEIDPTLHNYLDIAKMKFKNIFTTNYDFLINKYMNNTCIIPQVVHKVEINSQLFFNKSNDTNIWHIHGHIADSASIVISEEKYNINVINYSSIKNGHSYKIRKILSNISYNNENKGISTDNVVSIDNMEFPYKIKVCKEIKRLLIENYRIFINYGSRSEVAIKNPLSNAYEIWEKRKCEKIIPNNDMIIKLIEDNKKLFNMDAYEICYEFIEHANGFKKSCDSILEDVKQFPKKFDEVISKYAKF